MTVVCAWCGKDLGTKPGPDEVSHGICGACLEARAPAAGSAAPGPAARRDQREAG